MHLINDYENEFFYRKKMVLLCVKNEITNVSSFGIGGILTSIFFESRILKFFDKTIFLKQSFKILLGSLLSILLLPFIILLSAYSLGHLNWYRKANNLSKYKSLFLSYDNSGFNKVNASSYMDSSLCILHDNISKNKKADQMSMFKNLFAIEKFFFVPFLYPIFVLRDFISCFKMLCMNQSYQTIDVFYLIDFFLRIPHKCLYEITMYLYLKRGIFNTVITSNKEDRFAMLEARLCRMNKIPLICIPHGVEYELLFPTGLAGDKFYCTSEAAKNSLSDIYNEKNKFVYNKKLLNDIYNKNLNNSRPLKIIFFSEPRVKKVNIKICKYLLDMEIDFLLKIHPSESKDYYINALGSIKFEDDYDNAIKGNICIARTSSILLEAQYNLSYPICVSINDYDRYVVNNLIPSLRSENIVNVSSLSDLYKNITSIKDTISYHG